MTKLQLLVVLLWFIFITIIKISNANPCGKNKMSTNFRNNSTITENIKTGSFNELTQLYFIPHTISGIH